ncbi:MAG: hypothetical protein CMJ36_01095, partial [Phycisphaerae bacterium]|nr:hypothetical protein [Phycisphaerae bacterium]
MASGLSNRLGADVQIREGSWEGGTTFKFSGITVRAIDLDGVPGEIANIETLVLTLNPGGILGNEAIVQDVAVGPGVLRVAEHVVDGSDINIARLFRNRGDPSRGGGRVQDEALPALPRSIIMNSILLETGRYSGDAFFLKGRMSLSGSVRPDPENMHEYQLELQGSSDQTGIVAVSGTFDPNTPRLKATMSEGELSAAILDFLPSMLSKKAEEMDLEGLISNVKIDWEGGLVPRVQVDLRDVSLTLSDSLDLPDFWARYSNEQYQKSPDPPRMHVNTGSILLEGTTLEFENLQGTFTSVSDEKLAEIPFMLDMSLKDLPIEPMLEGEGFDQVSSSFPFTLELQTDDFTLGEGVDTADIPLIVAQILAMFKVQTCTVSTRIRAERDAPANGIAGTLMYEGALAIRRASGAYVGFPYPLAELDADVEFNESTVFVRSLDARG